MGTVATWVTFVGVLVCAGCTVSDDEDGCVTACTEVFEDCDAGCDDEDDECTVTCEGDRDLCFTGCDDEGEDED